MASEWSSLSNIHLESDSKARSKAVAVTDITPGQVIFATPALATVLLPAQKGRRCDGCLRCDSDLSVPLRKCSKCHSYWYCGEECQQSQWKLNHRKLCKKFNEYHASQDFQQLPDNGKLDALLLSQMIAQLFTGSGTDGPLAMLIEGQPTPFSTFSSLLAGPVSNQIVPPICPMGSKDVLMDEVLNEIYNRFGNNNFTIHSHLVSIAHGVFPLASRLFNHSCVNNAATKYIFTESEPPRMEVVALRTIAKGDEICIPYLDPALYQTRQQIFNLTYGFNCTCPSCVFAHEVEPIPKPPPLSSKERQELVTSLRNYVFPELVGDSGPRSLKLPQKPFSSTPRELLPCLHESFLESLSQNFSDTSHDGPYTEALDVGLTIIAVYALLYPPNYPQIGMHLLEMAKTTWNAIMQSQDNGAQLDTAHVINLRGQLAAYLAACKDVMNIFGQEGDLGTGPLKEIRTLEAISVDEG